MTEKPEIRSNDKLLRNKRYLETINNFAQALIATQSIYEIVWTVTNEAISNLGYYDCILYLYDSKKDYLIQASAFGPKNGQGEEILDPIMIRPGQGIVGSVFATREAEMIADTSKDPRYIVDDEFRYSELAVPIIHDNKVLGVIDSEHPDKDFFTQDDLDVLTTIASLVAVKIDQAQKAEQIRNYQYNLEKLVSKKTAELEEANKQLVKSNQEKEVLLSEVHHRVKNNLQVIMSLLNIQSSQAITEREKYVFECCQNRVKSMALIHQRLYREKDFSNVSFDKYLSEMAEQLLISCKPDDAIQLDLEIENVSIDINNAISLGLIFNELITNSLIHGFHNRKEGHIKLTGAMKGDHFELCYTDDGPGFDIHQKKENSFGLELVGILSEQIGAEIKFDTNQGMKANIYLSLN